MDPNENLREQLERASHIIWCWENAKPVEGRHAARLAELVLALDEWLSQGGVLPERLRAARTVKIELCDKLDRRGRTTEVVVGGKVLSRHPSSVSRRAANEAAELAARTLKAAGVVTVLTEEK